MPHPGGDTGTGSKAVPATPKPKPAAKPAASRSAARKPVQNPAGGFTARTWAIALLGKLGAPKTSANIQLIVSWEAAEGGHWHNTAYYNPLNTTLTLPGATSMNDVGVKAYTSWEQGLEATAQTLRQGNMSGIMAALHTGKGGKTGAQAIVDSPWGTHSIHVDNYHDYGTTAVNTKTPTVTSGALGTGKPQSVSDYLNDPNIVSQYGYLAAYMKDPEIGPILAKAAQGGWNEAELLSALQKTKWWKTTSATARSMQELQREDPASYKLQLTNQVAQVNALATSMGLTIDPKRATQLATTSLWSGWSSLQIQEAVGAEFHYNPKAAYTGTAGKDIQSFKQMAANYLVPLSDQTLGSWTQQALQGKINPDDFTGYLSQQAKTLFPWMAHAIDSGITPNQYLDPYRQAAAQTLEVDPNSINFTDPKWLGLVQSTDPKTGQRAESGLANAMIQMRTDPRFGYDKTQGGRDQAAAFGASIAQSFGYQAGSPSGGVPNPQAA